MNIVLGIVGAAIAGAIFSFFGIVSRRMVRPPDRWGHRGKFVDLDRPRVDGLPGVRTRQKFGLGRGGKAPSERPEGQDAALEQERLKPVKVQ